MPSLQEQLTNCNELIAKNREEGWPDLDPKRKAFAYFYLESYNQRLAAEKAGFNPSTGSKLLREPLLMAFITDAQEVMAQRSLVNRDFVNFQWLKLLPKVMGEEEVAIVDRKEGLSFFAKEFNANAAAKVLTELSKSTNFYADGSDSKGAVTVNINLEAMGIKEIGATIEGKVNG